MARQLVSHRHVYVNGKKVNIASYEVKPGDVINLSTKALVNPTLKKTLTEKNDIMPEWLIRKAAVGKVERLPRRDEIGDQVDEQLVVEYYSR